MTGRRNFTSQELFEAISTGFAKIDERLIAVERRLTGLEERTANLENRIAHIESGIRTLSDEIEDKIEETYGRMLNDHEDRLAGLEATT